MEKKTYSNAARVSAGNHVVDDSDDGSNEPEPVDPGEQSARSKHPLGTNNSPNDTGVVESGGTWASEALRLRLRAELRDVA